MQNYCTELCNGRLDIITYNKSCCDPVWCTLTLFKLFFSKERLYNSRATKLKDIKKYTERYCCSPNNHVITVVSSKLYTVCIRHCDCQRVQPIYRPSGSATILIVSFSWGSTLLFSFTVHIFLIFFKNIHQPKLTHMFPN